MRAFVAQLAFVVAIDEEKARSNEQRNQETPVTVEELKEYVRNALRVYFDYESHGNACGVQNLEVAVGEVTELSEDQRKKLYGK